LVDIYSPDGDCVYRSTDEQQPLLFAALGTGAGALCGIIKDAIFRGHKGKIKFLIGGLSSDSFYLDKELNELRLAGVDIHQVALETSPHNQKFIFKANVYDYAQQLFNDVKDAKIYLCGAPSFVQKLRKQCFVAGAAMKNIHSDSFSLANQ